MNSDQIPQSVDELYQSKYLKAEDLRGKSFILTIRDVQIIPVNDRFSHQQVMKPCLWFQGASKGMILNKTQAFRIQEQTGTGVFKSWIGHTILIRPAQASNGKPTIHIDKPPADKI